MCWQSVQYLKGVRWCVGRGDLHSQAISETPELVNAQPSGRWSALHQFADAGMTEAVKWLLANGADRTAKTKDGQLPYDVGAESLQYAQSH